jgi:hypothetical protein
MIWKRTRVSHKDKQDPVVRELKKADLEMLELAAAIGEIDLKYLDESGLSINFGFWIADFGLSSPLKKRLETLFLDFRL